MKKIFFPILFFGVVTTTACAKLRYVDFDVSMQVDKFSHFIDTPGMLERFDLEGPELLSFFKTLYEKNSFLQIIPAKESRVPKIIHQIWIGKNIPTLFLELQKSWTKYHPDWEYRLWTYDDILHFDFQNKDIMLESHNPGELSDMMRYEILYQLGGVYIDFDFECLAPLDKLNHLYDFYIGIQPLDSEFVQLGIGLIGSVPGHPILKHAIKELRKSWQAVPHLEQDPPQRTGPIFFTKSFFACAGKYDFLDIALPAHYLYPLGCKEFSIDPDEWREKGAFGIHHWAGTWLRPSFRKPKFQNLELTRLKK